MPPSYSHSTRDAPTINRSFIAINTRAIANFSRCPSNKALNLLPSAHSPAPNDPLLDITYSQGFRTRDRRGWQSGPLLNTT